MNKSLIVANELMDEIKQLISEAKNNADRIVNSIITILYWRIGDRINREILNSERGEYGAEIVSTLARQLVSEFGRGYSEKSLRHMVKFSQVFSDFEIISTLARQLSWSHFKEIIYLNDSLMRQFYIEMCLMDKWSVRTLRNRIDSMLFERTALSAKPEDLIEIEIRQIRETKSIEPETVLKDPYLLDFLGLKDHYLEKDLEDSILREIELFILELGAGFSFIERQKRIMIDNEDYYIDLLFFNRKLKRLVAVELKTSKFKAEYKGQMELYLRWLDRYEKQDGEFPPLGIIMCTDKNIEQIELLELDKSGIHVAEYLTELPDKELLQKKFETAIKRSRLKFENK
jgi:predicted nuclease of restriction endonuclease-like (RecB) superfamily